MGHKECGTPQNEKPPVSKDGIMLAFSDQALAHFDFQLPEVEGGALTIRQGEQALSLQVQYLAGEETVVAPVQPHIPPDDRQPAMHAWGTQFLPYAILPDGAHYGIRIHASRELAGVWSQPVYEPYTERGVYLSLDQKEALVQRGSGLVIFARLNDGDVVSAVRPDRTRPFYEIGTLLGGAETPEEGDELVLSERVRKDGDQGTGESFIFRQLAEPGTAANEIRDRAGEVDVIICTADIKRIIEIRTRPLILPSSGFGSQHTLQAPMRSYDPTGRGETTFGAAQTRRVDLIQGENITPAFRFRLKLAAQE